MKSTQFSLSSMDLVKGLVMAALVPALVIIQQSVTAGSLIFDWKAIATSAIGGFIAYLLKNFFTDDIAVAQKTLVEAREKETAVNQPK